MTTDTQTLIDAVEQRETTDSGGVPTTRDVADAVPYAYAEVERTLRALERDGRVESTTFGGDRVWLVPGDDDTPDGTTDTRDIGTTTRDPLST